MIKKLVLSAAMTSFFAVPTLSSANSAEGLGLGVNYGLFAGPTLELTYPLTDTLQIRGALSNGMGLSETTSDTDIDYEVEADGGINRLALDYHPFGSGFFLSAGYAVNSFELGALGTSSAAEVVEIGDDTYTVTSDVALNGKLDWENGPTASLGWGHSPATGFGFLIEIGAIFTGSAGVSLSGTGTVTDGTDTLDVSTDPTVLESLQAEETELENDVADYTVLPIFQAGITYRF
ncbi:MAG: hypothetical protein U9R28_03025 [Pseudomonadota bacterium]|nr:hypothetical protein [Pseudomonadota bacterium]